jgi:hypothetical protein
MFCLSPGVMSLHALLVRPIFTGAWARFRRETVGPHTRLGDAYGHV